MLVHCQKKEVLEVQRERISDGSGRQMSCRRSPIAGQSSGAERGHMRVVRPVVDRGEWWSHPTPSPGSLQKQEIQNNRKDPLFYQIPACNLAPLELGVERERRKATAKWGQRRPERPKQKADMFFVIWNEFRKPEENMFETTMIPQNRRHRSMQRISTCS